MGLFSSIVGGVFGRKAEKRATHRAEQARKEFLLDRKSDRTYSEIITKRDRQYAERLLRDDRDYARRSLADQRRYDERSVSDSRAYDARLRDAQWAREDKYDARNHDRLQAQLTDDRAYSERRLNDDRAYADRLYRQDKADYETDRDLMQKRSNELSEKSAASRGIDFIRMRDDAIKAGYNPMTALAFAQNYATNVDYQLQGGVYSPRANYNVASGEVPTGAGYAAQGAPGGGSGGSVGGGGGGAPVPMSTPIMSSPPVGGSFSAGGGGYQSSPSSGLSAASFFAEKLDAAADSWFSKPPARDPLADALRKALSVNDAAEDAKNAQIPRGFGYDLTEVKPFKPALSTGVPPLREPGMEMRPASSLRPQAAPYRQQYINVRHPNGKMGKLDNTIARRLDIKAGDTLTAGEWTELVGELGEVENVMDHADIRKTATGWKRPFEKVGPEVSRAARDYLSSGRTGKKLIARDPNPQAGWMEEFFQ